MANYDRQSDDVRVFDAADDEEDVEGSRLPLLIVIALVVLAAFAAVVWLAYQRGVQQGHSEVPREIAAEPGPVKVAPANPGGTATPYTGLKIYQQPAPSDDQANSEPPPPPQPAAATPAPVTAVPKPVAATPAPPAPAMAAAQPAPKPAATPPATAKTAPPTPKPEAAVAPPVPKPAPAKPEVTPAETPAPAGGGLVQIGAYKSMAEAEGAWKTYKAKHAALVGELSDDVLKVDLGAKGTWYRLRAVTASKADAGALCAKLKAEGGDCLVAK